MNQSGPEMKGTMQPATLFLLSESNGGMEKTSQAYSEIGSRTGITNLGVGGGIEVMFAMKILRAFRFPISMLMVLCSLCVPSDVVCKILQVRTVGRVGWSNLMSQIELWKLGAGWRDFFSLAGNTSSAWAANTTSLSRHLQPPRRSKGSCDLKTDAYISSAMVKSTILCLQLLSHAL